MVVYPLSSGIQEAEAGRFPSSKTVWSTYIFDVVKWNPENRYDFLSKF